MREGDISGVRIPQNCTALRTDTTQNNMRKPPTALKLPGHFSIPQTAWFGKTAIPQLKIKIPAKPYHPYAPSCGKGDNQMPGELLKFPIDQRTLSRSTSVSMAR